MERMVTTEKLLEWEDEKRCQKSSNPGDARYRRHVRKSFGRWFFLPLGNEKRNRYLNSSRRTEDLTILRADRAFRVGIASLRWGLGVGWGTVF